jgi:DNA-directed RNA polymerase specialized sigma24 family protein
VDATNAKTSENDASHNVGSESTKDLVAAAINGLTHAQLVRLKFFAQCKSIDGGDDLLQEAIARTLDGAREWNVSVSFELHLIGVMRSIASSWFRARHQSGSVPDNPSAEPSQERLVAAKEQLDAIRTRFRSDRSVTVVIKARAMGLTAPEAQQKFGISAADYQAALKRLKRAAVRFAL